MRLRTIGMTALLIMMAAPAVAQRGRRGPARDGMRDAMGAHRVENALRMRERLELTEGQVAQLDALRRTQVAERQAATGAIAEIQSQLRAGQLSREEFRDAMQGRRDSALASGDDPLSVILTEGQVSQLGRDGRRGGVRGARGRGQRGFRSRGEPRFRSRRSRGIHQHRLHHSGQSQSRHDAGPWRGGIQGPSPLQGVIEPAAPGLCPPS